MVLVTFPEGVEIVAKNKQFHNTWPEPEPEPEPSSTNNVKECYSINEYGNYNIPGAGPNAEVVTTPGGGKHSKDFGAYECIPPLALAKTAEVMASGKRKYGINNWLNIPDVLTHTGHAMGHINAFHAGDTQEGKPYEHLAHAICRAMFALDLLLRQEQTTCQKNQ
jgi:hypothetical protein